MSEPTSLSPPLSYILPVRKSTVAASAALDDYLAWLSGQAEVIVVDASPAAIFRDNERRWRSVMHVAPNPALETTNGKVWGVLTGLSLASHERIVIADDDVRYDGESLAAVIDLLDESEVVRPQNYFSPLPWHACWDSGRSLLNRMTGGDWPGTLAVRRSYLQDGYDGDCIFENLEMVRTVQAAGGRELVAGDVFVRRLPPTARHFFSQRVRQAYDEWARPLRFLAQLSLLPLALAVACYRPVALLPLAGVSVLVAELGRRKGQARRHFPPAASLMSPLWVTERMVCAWLALLMRVTFGGARYHGRTISRPATPLRVLRERHARRRQPEGSLHATA